MEENNHSNNYAYNVLKKMMPQVNGFNGVISETLTLIHHATAYKLARVKDFDNLNTEEILLDKMNQKVNSLLKDIYNYEYDRAGK